MKRNIRKMIATVSAMVMVVSSITVINTRGAEVETCITSDAVMVEGFQIKTNSTADNVAFRTVCKAPNIGTSITGSDDISYEIASMGTIYTLDVNSDGYRRNDVLDPVYTILNPNKLSDDIINDADRGYSYEGANLYNEEQRTYGYVATAEKGVVEGWNPDDLDNTYYVRTMNKMSMENAMEYTIHVRAFAVATDGTIIYGTKTASISVAELADYLYENSKAPNYTAHQYLYNNILTKVSNANPYYRTSTLPYGWDGNLYVPSSPTYVVD